MQISKHIVVNATALNQSGALGILKQFIENIPDIHQWIIFVSNKATIDSLKKNVRIVPIANVKKLHKRFLWDLYGLSQWLKRNKITPMACVSLQNTGFRTSVKNIPDFIYFHNSIPFYPYYWNPLKQNQRSLWFYKHIYPFFVKLFLRKNTKVFVQLDFIKKGFSNSFHHNPDKVSVFYPSVLKPQKEVNIKLPIENLNLFYPATTFFYKNHEVLFKAIEKTERNLNLYLTTNEFQGKKNVIELGVIPYEKVCAMYHSCDALVFPSYIETFGLPLLEAAMTGMPILAADLPYAREVLEGYEGVRFIKHDDADAWKNAIENLEKGKRFKPFDISERPSWDKLIEEIINSTK